MVERGVSRRNPAELVVALRLLHPLPLLRHDLNRLEIFHTGEEAASAPHGDDRLGRPTVVAKKMK